MISDDYEKMRKAIDKYQMPFIHYTELKGWNSHITEKYAANVKGYLLQEELAQVSADTIDGGELNALITQTVLEPNGCNGCVPSVPAAY